MKTLKCDREQVIEWLYKHLDDCPCDWHTDDYADDLTIIFETSDSQITVHSSLRSGYDATIISTSPTEFPMKETMYLVTVIEFDVTHGGEAFDDLWTDEEYQNLKNDAIGLWYAQSENHLCDKITQSMGYLITHIESTTNTLHPLTSYL